MGPGAQRLEYQTPPLGMTSSQLPSARPTPPHPTLPRPSPAAPHPPTPPPPTPPSTPSLKQATPPNMPRSKQEARKSSWMPRKELRLRGCHATGPAELAAAIERRDLAAVSALLAKRVPAELDQVEDALDDPELLELLLAANAHVTDDVEVDTPLKTAAARGLLRAVQALLAHGAAVDAQDEDGLTPLFAAIGGEATGADKAAIVDVLLEAGARPDGESDDDSPLHHLVAVADEGDGDWAARVAARLLAAGANPLAVNGGGLTPGELALEAGCPGSVWRPILAAAAAARRAERWGAGGW
jgi:hypothetical protein